jgi:hypothetical protein
VYTVRVDRQIANDDEEKQPSCQPKETQAKTKTVLSDLLASAVTNASRSGIQSIKDICYSVIV